MDSFAQYKAQARADLTRDSNLDKASDLVAERNVLLMNPDIPDALKRAQLKELNRKVAHWTQKVRQPFSGYDSQVPQVGEDSATDPTKAMVHALLKSMKTEPEEEEPALETKTPANVRVPKPRNVLTPKPTPTPRRPKPKKPATPLSGITDLPDTRKEFDRILTQSTKDFGRIQKRYERLKKKQTEEDHESTPRQSKKKTTLGKAVKRGLKKGLQEGAKQWLDFWDTVEHCMAPKGWILLRSPTRPTLH